MPRINHEDSRPASGRTGAVPPGRAPNLIRWGAVIAGAIVSLAFMVLMTALWFALAYDSNVSIVHDNLNWWVGGTAIAAMFLGGLLAGMLSGVRGAAVGFINGTTVWAIFLIAALVLAVPSGLRLDNVTNTSTAAASLKTQLPGSGLWVTFWALLIGVGAAGLGGILGGAMRRTVKYPVADVQGTYATQDAPPTEDDYAGYPAAPPAPPVGGRNRLGGDEAGLRRTQVIRRDGDDDQELETIVDRPPRSGQVGATPAAEDTQVMDGLMDRDAAAEGRRDGI